MALVLAHRPPEKVLGACAQCWAIPTHPSFLLEWGRRGGKMLATIPPLPVHERVIWEGRAAWADQAILFLFMGAAGMRLFIALRYGQWLTAVLYALAIVF